MPRWDKNRITPARVLAILDGAMTALTAQEITDEACRRYDLPPRYAQYSRTTLALRTLRASKLAQFVGVADACPGKGGRPRQLWERIRLPMVPR